MKCHGEIGMGDVEKFYPRINGQHYEYMVRQFEWIRDHKRRNANPEMVEQIKNFSDKDMQRSSATPLGSRCPRSSWPTRWIGRTLTSSESGAA